MKFKNIIFVNIFASQFLWACSNDVENKKVFEYRGAISEEFVNDAQILSDRSTLLMASQGGVSNIGLEAAKIIQQKKVNIIVDGNFGMCGSACAEYILPAAEDITFKNNPLIAYHQNPQIIHYLLNQYANSGLEYCGIVASEARKGNTLLRDNKMNADFWYHTLKRLDLEFFIPIYNDNLCPGYIMEFKNSFWLPTSAELKELMGLDFKGKVCSDNFDCYSKKNRSNLEKRNAHRRRR